MSETAKVLEMLKEFRDLPDYGPYKRVPTKSLLRVIEYLERGQNAEQLTDEQATEIAQKAATKATKGKQRRTTKT